MPTTEADRPPLVPRWARNVTPQKPKKEKLRDLGFEERLLASRSFLGYYHNVALTANYKGPERSSLTPPLIYTALAKVIMDHPHLSIVPMDQGTQKPYFTRLAQFDTSRACTFTVRRYARKWNEERDVELDEILETQHNIKFEHTTPPTPFWRIVVLYENNKPSDFTACFVFHHSLFDTKSAIIFHQEFAAALSSVQPPDLTTTVVIPRQLPLLPPNESVHRVTPSQEFLAKVLARSRVNSPGLWSGDNQRMPLVSRLRTSTMPTDITSAFTTACKQEMTSVTAALQTLVAAVLFAAVPFFYTQLCCNCVISPRDFLEIDAETAKGGMACWVTTWEELFDRSTWGSSCYSWEVARKCKEKINALISNKAAEAEGNLLRHQVNDLHDWHSKKLGQKRGESFMLSNAGLLPKQTKDQRWRLGTMLSTQCANVVGPAFRASIITGGDGQLTVSYAWQQGVVDDALVDRIIKTVKIGFCQIAARQTVDLSFLNSIPPTPTGAFTTTATIPAKRLHSHALGQPVVQVNEIAPQEQKNGTLHPQVARNQKLTARGLAHLPKPTNTTTLKAMETVIHYHLRGDEATPTEMAVLEGLEKGLKDRMTTAKRLKES